MPATEQDITYTLSPAGVAALQSFIDRGYEQLTAAVDAQNAQIDAQNANLPKDAEPTSHVEYPTKQTVEEYVTNFLANQEESWIATALAMAKDLWAYDFRTMPMDDKLAVAKLMKTPVDPALLARMALP